MKSYAIGFLWLALVPGLLSAQTSKPTHTNDPAVASVKLGKDGKPEARFMTLHQKYLDRAKQGNIDLLFLGDSITEGFNADVFKKHYGKLNAANFGVSGDRTQHVLW